MRRPMAEYKDEKFGTEELPAIGRDERDWLDSTPPGTRRTVVTRVGALSREYTVDRRPLTSKD